MGIRIKNWSAFQHFKDRRPPWIKLHRDILEQRDINMISDRSFRVLISIWLLASEDKDKNGAIPCSDDIAFRLRMDKSKVIKALEELKDFLIHDDINTISEGYQVDEPETETETEERERREAEEEARLEAIEKQKVAHFESFWNTYPRKAGKDPAEKAFAKLDIEEMQLAISDCASRFEGEEKKFIPHPATYVNQKRWKDDEPINNKGVVWE